MKDAIKGVKVGPGLEAKYKWIVGREKTSLVKRLGIKYHIFTKTKVAATMPVDGRSRQPFGLLHGGASVALAESLASVGTWLNVDENKFHVVGIEINANHIRAIKSGTVTGEAIPLHVGRTTQVWEIKIKSSEGKLVCASRCTLAAVMKD